MEPAQERPRPVMIKLLSSRQKQVIYQNVNKLKGNQKWKNTFINDDLSPDEARKQRDLRILAAHCRNLNFDCKQKGMALILDNEKFTYDRLDKLPDDKKMERVKVPVEPPKFL